jgi:hypothetical protein
MRPGQLRVFDGLRLTTEHLNHLQEALRSGVQDLREILGLGVVYRGCEVSAAGDSAVTVQPGLAFDLQKNRLVFDEPKTVPVVFEPDTATQFVCLKYEQIEDGQVEDHFTLLWDSCSVIVRSSLPAAQDNLVVLARLDKTADNHFTITDLTRPAEAGPAVPGAGESPAPDGAGTSTTPTNGTGSESGEPGASPPTPETGSAPETPETTRPTTAGEGSTPTETTGTPVPTEVGTLAPLLPRSWSIHQGIERLTGAQGTGIDLGDLLIGPLRNKLATPNDAAAEVRFSLFDQDVAVSFPVLSLSCQAGLTVTVNRVVDTTPPAASEAPAGPPTPDTITVPVSGPSASLQVHTTAHGEVTFTAEKIAQFGVSTMQLRAGGPDALQWTSALTERGVAHALLGGTDGKLSAPGTLGEVLQHLQLVLRVEQGVTSGFKLVGNLIWNGGASEDSIKALHTHKPTLTWNGFLAWKALGAP